MLDYRDGIWITEEQFLDLYQFTRPNVTPIGFLAALNNLVADQKTMTATVVANQILNHYQGYDDFMENVFRRQYSSKFKEL